MSLNSQVEHDVTANVCNEEKAKKVSQLLVHASVAETVEKQSVDQYLKLVENCHQEVRKVLVRLERCQVD